MKHYLAIPLGVLRRFTEENKNEPDEYLQLFELKPEFIFSENELSNRDQIKRKSTIVSDGKYLPKHKD